MTELQSRLLDILKWYHEVCQKENLKYFIMGGTALGAVRHGGFIPWDDDIDVAMPRADYEKFIKLKSDGRYVIESPGENEDFQYPYTKVYDTRTTLTENTRHKIKRGLYIDVFPLDGAGNTMEESRENFKKIDKKINLMLALSCGINPKRNALKNAAIVLSRCVPKFILNPQKILAKINEESVRKSYDECKYIANYAGNYHFKEISEKAWFGEGKLYKFEDTKVYAQDDVDAYLTAIYGDYMKLPPADKRVSHHDYLYIDLNKSYLEK